MKNNYIAVVEDAHGKLRQETFQLQLSDSNPWAVAEFSSFLKQNERIRGVVKNDGRILIQEVNHNAPSYVNQA